jgi:hypothetical protein
MTSLAIPIESGPVDERAMRKLLADLELVSHGRTMRVDGRVTGSTDPSPMLRVDDEPYPHEHYRQRWQHADDDERRQVLADARAHLESIRKTPPPPEHLLERCTYPWYVQIANDRETPVAELARLHGVSRKSIYAWREKYSLESRCRSALGPSTQ